MQDICDLPCTSEKSSDSPCKEHFFYPPFAASSESKANSSITLTLLYNDLYRLKRLSHLCSASSRSEVGQTNVLQVKNLLSRQYYVCKIKCNNGNEKRLKKKKKELLCEPCLGICHLIFVMYLNFTWLFA